LYCIRDQRGYDYWTDEVVYTTLKEAKKGLIEARRHAAQLSYDESSYAAAHLEIFLKDSDGNDERFL
jgi:hypothetical protein